MCMDTVSMGYEIGRIIEPIELKFAPKISSGGSAVKNLVSTDFVVCEILAKM